MEIAKFAAEDVITASVTEPTVAIKFDEGDASYNHFSATATYNEF